MNRHPLTEAHLDHADEHFDPKMVPVYPVVPIELRHAPDGRTEAFVHGRRLDVPEDTEPGDAALAAAAQEAAMQHGDAVRVAATDADGHTYRMVVHADGRSWDLDERPEAPRRPPWLLPAMTAGAVTVAALLVGGLALATRDDTPAASRPAAIATPDPVATELPVLAPDGWSTHAKWASTVLADDQPTVALVGRTAVAETADGTMQGLDLRSGTPAWTSSLPRRGLDAGPALTSLGSAQAIAAQSGDELLWWPTTGASEPISAALPAQASVTFDGTSPLIRGEGQKAYAIDGRGRLQTRVVPAGSTPLAANRDASITTVSDTGLWWHSTDPNTAKDGAPLPRPFRSATPLKVAGYSGHHLLMLWTAADGTVTGTVHDDSDAMKITAKAALGQERSDLTWSGSPTKSWGVLGNKLIDLERGRVRDLGDWRTSVVINDLAYGESRLSGTALAVDRTGQLREVGDDPTIPVAISGNEALVVAGDGPDPRLYALPPEP